MLTLINTVPEANIHIYLPCARQVLQRIVNETGFADKIEDNIFITAETMVQGSPTDKNRNPALPHDRLEARLIPIVNPVNNKWDAGQSVTLMDNLILSKRGDKAYDRLPFNPHANTAKYPIFWDADSGVSLVEDTIPCAFTLECTWRITEMVNATELMSRILSVYTNGEMIADLELVYDYPLSQATLQTMLGLARMRGVPDRQFVAYLMEKSNRLISLNSYREMTGEKELVVNRNHCRTIFQIEMGQEGPTNAGEYDDVNMTITVAFARANQTILSYPLSIMNRPVPRSLVPLHEENRFKASLPSQWKDKATDAYWHHLYPDNKGFVPYQYPWWDDFTLPQISKAYKSGYTMFCSALVTLDDITNPKGVTKINIADGIASCKINPEVLEKYRALGEKALQYEDEYAIGVFADDLQVDISMLEFDGSTITIKNRRIDRTYRLVLSKRKEIINGPRRVFWVACVTIRTDRDEQ